MHHLSDLTCGISNFHPVHSPGSPHLARVTSSVITSLSSLQT